MPERGGPLARIFVISLSSEDSCALLMRHHTGLVALAAGTVADLQKASNGLRARERILV